MMRRGIAVPIVLAIVVILAVFGGALMLLSSASSKEVDALESYLRAVSVGESAFARIVARLSAAPWCDRWFKARPDIQLDVPAQDDGSYDYAIGDTPSAGGAGGGAAVPSLLPFSSASQADLLVRATDGRTTVTLFWRLTVPEDSLESFRRVVPALFFVASGQDQPSASALAAMSRVADDLSAQRAANAARTGPLARRLATDSSAPEIETSLGYTPDRPVLDGVELPGGAQRDDGPYTQAVLRGEANVPQIPLDTVVQSPSDTATVVFYYEGDPASTRTLTVQAEQLAGGQVRFPLLDQVVAYRDSKQAVVEVTLSNPIGIQEARVQVQAYNGDGAYPRGVYYSLDGQGGYLGAQGIDPVNISGSGVLAPGQTSGVWDDNLADLPVGYTLGQNLGPGGQLSLLTLMQQPGAHKMTCYTSTYAQYGPTSWVSLKLVLRRNPAGGG